MKARSDNAQARALKGRVLAGDLDWLAIEVAAYLGDETALQACDLAVPAREVALPPAGPQRRWWRRAAPSTAAARLELWVRGLERWGSTTATIAGVAVAELLLPLWSEGCPRFEQPNQAIRAIEAFLECPCEAHHEAGRRAALAACEADRSPAGPGYPLNALARLIGLWVSRGLTNDSLADLVSATVEALREHRIRNVSSTVREQRLSEGATDSRPGRLRRPERLKLEQPRTRPRRIRFALPFGLRSFLDSSRPRGSPTWSASPCAQRIPP